MPLILVMVEMALIVNLVFSGYHMYVFIVLVSGADLLAQRDIWIIELWCTGDIIASFVVFFEHINFYDVALLVLIKREYTPGHEV